MDRKQTGRIAVMIETPKGSRNKYNWEPKEKCFRLKKTLPLGSVFPFDFGFIPGTRGGDGDPLDVLVIMDEPAYPGILVDCRIIGALKARQQIEKTRKTTRNDRLIAVPESSSLYADLKEVAELPETVRSEIELFFRSYNEQEGKEFRPLEWCAAREAGKLIKKAKTGSATH